MDAIVSFLGDILGHVMKFCYDLVPNYGLAILLFTILVKIILLPVSIMLHKNSIKMVKMQPELNFIKANNFGATDQIGEEQLKLYKKYNYHPMLGLVPLATQLILLMGVIDVIYKPLRHILRFPADQVAEAAARFISLTGMNPESRTVQIAIVDAVRNGKYLDEMGSILGQDALARMQAFHMNFLGLNLADIPSQVGGALILVPLLAAFCAWLLCEVQNRVNVLQSEQGKVNKIGTMLLSVGLSLYLGFFVPAGVGVYWMYGNLTAILQLFFLNAVISPKKYIDYEQLEKSKVALAKVSRRAKANKKLFEKDPYRDKEKQDYKAFYKLHNKKLVFYSEKNGFYKYFQNIIEYLLENSDIVIDYVTNDPKDAIFEKTSERFRTYYIGPKKIISFMMKMDADVVVMSTPDLEKYQIKRSLVRKDVEYIYLPHGVNSGNAFLRTGALDYFDTIFAPGPRNVQEIRAIEKLHGTKEKTLVEWGSSVIDNMLIRYASMQEAAESKREKTVLIAPSWKEDNLLDLCAEEMLDQLLTTEYRIILRPHPQYLRYAMDRIEMLKKKYSGCKNFVMETDFSSNETVYMADVLITDWSSIAFEYSFATLKPTLFINAPMTVVNQEWQKIEVVPLDIAMRKEIGMDVELNELGKINGIVDDFIKNAASYAEKIREVREHEIFSLGSSGKVGAEYIIQAITRIEENKEEYLKYI